MEGKLRNPHGFHPTTCPEPSAFYLALRLLILSFVDQLPAFPLQVRHAVILSLRLFLPRIPRFVTSQPVDCFLDLLLALKFVG